MSVRTPKMTVYGREVEERLIRKWDTEDGRRLIAAGVRVVGYLLEERRPLTPEVAAGLLGEEVMGDFARLKFPLETDGEGNIIGAGISLASKPPHVMPSMDMFGARFYGWCAMDALMFPSVLKQRTVVTAVCPVTGRQISMIVDPEAGITELRPIGAVITLVPPEGDDLRETFCDRTVFAADVAAATRLAEADPERAVVSVEDGFRIGKRLAGLF